VAPNDPAWPDQSVIGICGFQIKKARQAAELRRLTPDAFDANGNMMPGQSGRAWKNYIEAYPISRIVI